MTPTGAADGSRHPDPERRITVFFDVDNTLIDNDRAKTALRAAIATVLGPDGERRFWSLYEQVRREQGMVNIPLMLARFAAATDADPALTSDERRRQRFALADIVMSFPYRDYLLPGAVEAVRQARRLGQVAVLSEGDAVFQPHKIWRLGLDPEIEGNVLVFDHKLEHLDEMLGAFPADHYVLVEDKPSILAAVKRKLGPRVTTVLVRQGAYAEQDPVADDIPPDVIYATIGDIAEQGFETVVPSSEPCGAIADPSPGA